MIDLGGKTVLVAGGSRGIGAAIVRAVAASGANVLLHYAKSRDAAEAIQNAIGSRSCRLIQADLGAVDAAAELWQAATKAEVAETKKKPKPESVSCYSGFQLSEET